MHPNRKRIGIEEVVESIGEAAASAAGLKRAAEVAEATMADSGTKGTVDNEVVVSRVAAANKWPKLSPRSAILKEQTIQRLSQLAGDWWQTSVDSKLENSLLDDPGPTLSTPTRAEKRTEGYRSRRRPPASRTEGQGRPQRVREAEREVRRLNRVAVVEEPADGAAAAVDLAQQEPLVVAAEPAAPAVLQQVPIVASEPAASSPTRPEVKESTKALAARAAETAAAKAASNAARKHAEALAASRRSRASRLVNAYGSPAIAGLAREPPPLPTLKSSTSAPVVRRTLGGHTIDPNYNLMERRVVGGSFSKLPRLEASMATRPSGRRPAERTRRAVLPAPLPLIKESARLSRRIHSPDNDPLFTAHAAAAAAAVDAVARERAASLQAKLQARILATSLASGTLQDEPRSERQPTQYDHLGRPIKLTAKGADKNRDAATSDDNAPVVSRVAAAKKWSHLSPRSAVLKEEAIQRLGTIPNGMHFAPEVSARDVADILERPFQRRELLVDSESGV